MPGGAVLFQKHISEYFVETGSCNGDGIQAALDAGFKNIISIELSEHLYNICEKRFQDNSCVRIIQGDSSLCLYQAVKDIDCKMTFWLDGHYSGEGTAISDTKEYSPLLKELDQIKAHGINNHTILIDDMRLWVNRGNVSNNFGKDEILKKVREINKNYIISYEDDVCAEQDILIAQV